MNCEREKKKTISTRHRVAQIVAAWQPGCEKMEREKENEDEMKRYLDLVGSTVHFEMMKLCTGSV